MIKIDNLLLKNFMSHTDSEIDFKEYEGLVLIEGLNKSGLYSSNGSGKSTILEGILYALTGDTLRGVGVNDVVNRNYKKDTHVSLSFKKGETSYSVSRYRKDDNFGDSLILYKELENVSKRVNKETQKFLDDILGISYKVLVSTMLLGEGLSSRFTQLSDPEKKSLIESTLNLQYDLSSSRSTANAKLSQLKLDKSNIEGKLSTLRELSTLDTEELEKIVGREKEIASKASKDMETLKLSIAEIQAKRAPLENKLRIVKDSLDRCRNINAEMKRLDEEALKYLEELKSIEVTATPVCNVCHQALVSLEAKENFRNTYREKVEAIHSRIAELSIELNSIPAESLLDEKYRSIEKELGQILSDFTNYNSELTNLSNTYWYATSKIESILKDLERHEASKSDIDSLELEEKNISECIEKYDYFSRLFAPTGIIVHVLSDAIDYINSRLSTYSEILLEKEYRINFVKGKLSLVDNKGSNYQSLSNGEKRRLDISIQFALHDYVHTYCGMKMDCCFIDEILDTLDDVGVDNIFDVLRLKLEYCQLRSIYVITHNNLLKDKFDKVITVVKDEKGDSRIVK